MKVHAKHEDAQAAIKAMRESFDIQDSPMVGIFWYDPKNHELFGIDSELAYGREFYRSSSMGDSVRTGKKLHKKVWSKEHHRGKDPRFQSEYTVVPRGRVFEFEGRGFKVYTGSWINKYPEAKQMVIDEFELPEDDTEFVQDSHWDIGHGWSDEIR